MTCNDTCQCHSRLLLDAPVIVPFTQNQAGRLWYILQERAELMAQCIEAREHGEDCGDAMSMAIAKAEHAQTQELADIVYAHTYDEAGAFRTDAPEPEPTVVIDLGLNAASIAYLVTVKEMAATWRNLDGFGQFQARQMLEEMYKQAVGAADGE